MSPKAAGLAAKKGYKNVKVYIAGVPAWKKAKQLMTVKAGWLSKNLNQHVVIIDARSKTDSSKASLKGAVAFSSSELVKMNKDFKAKKLKKSKKLLPGLVDKKAPVVIVGSSKNSKDAIEAFSVLVGWGYGGSVVLEGGVSAWKKAGLSLSGSAGSKISYVRKPIKGAVDSSKFAGMVKAGKIVVLDVRTVKEVKKGKIASSVHIPLDELEKNLAQLDKKAMIVTHCASGVRAGIAYQLLKKQGFDNAKFLNAIIKIDKKGKFRIE